MQNRSAPDLIQARLDALAQLDLAWPDRRVFCLGADERVVQYFVEKGCKVTCSDVDPYRIARIRQALPKVDARVISLQGCDLALSGTFDLGYCGELLNAYDPAHILDNVAGVCGFSVLIDGFVVDEPQPVIDPVDDEYGRRYCTSISFVVERFQAAGYPFYYVPRPRPAHDDYRFTYTADGAALRDGHPMRQMLLASRAKLEGPHLLELDSEDALTPDAWQRLPMLLLQRLVNRNYRPAPLRANAEWFVGSVAEPPPERAAADRLWRVLRRKTSNQGSVVIPWYNGIRLRLSLDDEIAKCVFVEGQFEPTGFWILDRLLQEGMTFVDAGANFGVFTLFASRKVGDNGTVVAFEPSQRELVKLRANVQDNRMTNVRLFADALGAEAGTAKLLVARMPYAGHNTLGGFAYDSTGLEREEEVALRPLDEVLATEKVDSVDLMKLDVEGAELTVLRGARRTLQRKRPVILMELSDRTLERQGTCSSEILEHLASLAYKVFEYTRRGFVEATPGEVYDGSNVIAVLIEYVDRTLAALS